jgi:uncharacterized protein Yka (UPF0111/DUF47 family)
MPRFASELSPEDRIYFQLFDEAGQNMLRAASLLHELLAGWPDGRQLAGEILDLEHEGDRITHEIIDRMNHSSVTPIERTDMLALASAIDDVVDFTEEVADYLGLYKIEAPMEQSIRLARVLADATQQLSESLAELCETTDVSAHTVEVNRLENEGDRITREGRDPLDGSLRAPRGRGRRHRACRQHHRGHRHQELLSGRFATRSQVLVRWRTTAA